MPKREISHLSSALLRIVRERFDNNKSALAKELGVSPSTVTRWIATGMVPGSDTVSHICRKLKITTAELMGDEAPASQRRDVTSAPIADEAQASAIDWMISRGEDPDSIAMAAAIIARRLPDGAKRPRLWWVAQIDELIHELG